MTNLFSQNQVEEAKTEETVLKNNEFTQEQLNLLRHIIKSTNNQSSRIVGNNKYEKLEKAALFLEQEKIELDQILNSYALAKDEINDFLSKKINFNSIQDSGVNKFLQNVLSDTKKKYAQVNNILDSENNDVSKRNVVSNSEFKIEDMKNKLIKQVTIKTKKIIKNLFESKNTVKIVKSFVDQGIQTNLTEKQLIEKIKAFINYEQMRNQLTATLDEKKELLAKIELLEQQKGQTIDKLLLIERKFDELNLTKVKLEEKINDIEFVLKNKKKKIAKLKDEKRIFQEKMEAAIERNVVEKQLISNKNEEIEKSRNEFRIIEKKYKSRITTLEEDAKKLNEEIQRLISENQSLNDLLEIYNFKNPASSNQYIEISSPSIANSPSINKNTLSPMLEDNKRRRSHLPDNKIQPTIEISSPLIANPTTMNKNTLSPMLEDTKRRRSQLPDNKIQPNTTQNLESKTLLKKKSVLAPKICSDSIQEEKKLLKLNIENLNISNHSKPEILSTFEKICTLLEEDKYQKNNIFANLKTLLTSKDADFAELLKINEKKPSISQITAEEPLGKKSKKFSLKKEDDPFYQEFIKWREDKKNSEKIKVKPTSRESIKQLKPEGKEPIIQVKLEVKESIKEIKLEKNEKQVNPGKKIEIKDQSKNKTILNRLVSKIDENRINQPRAQTAEAVITPKNEPINHIVMQSYPKPKRIRKTDIKSTNLTEGTPHMEKREENNQNFSKNKFLYKYPFKKIRDFKTLEDEQQQNFSDEFDDYFGNLYKKLIKQHEKCGPNCDHLKRFYHRVSFVNKHMKKEEFSINRSVIDKLPMVDNYYDVV